MTNKGSISSDRIADLSLNSGKRNFTISGKNFDL